MANKNGNTNPLAVLSLSRGAYKRVADKLGCDPSYVSRVARGERVSGPVTKALKAEMQQLRVLLNGR
jgi:transcriptional regulator with XRE-family HTH domain